MRPIQNNLANLQINQIAMEQAALQAAKNQHAERVHAQTAEEILKQQEQQNIAKGKNSKTSQTDSDDQNKSNSQNFKNLLNSKEGIPKTDSKVTPSEKTPPIQISHIDFKA
jgi:hypothetical protein